jgi:hypothetical protein
MYSFMRQEKADSFVMAKLSRYKSPIGVRTMGRMVSPRSFIVYFAGTIHPSFIDAALGSGSSLRRSARIQL